jgi:hypothetical protein
MQIISIIDKDIMVADRKTLFAGFTISGKTKIKTIDIKSI